MMDIVNVYMCFHIVSIKSTDGNKARLFPRPFFISNSRVLILAEAFRSATEKNELGGHVTVPCPSKLTQRSSTADWSKF